MFAAVGMAMVLGACSEETQQGIRDAIEEGQSPSDGDSGEPAPEEPAPEEPAPEEPAPEEPAPEETPDDVEEGLSDEDWLIIAILAVAAFAVILVATSLSSSRSRKKEAARASFNRSLDQVIGGSRWVHDQATIDVLGATNPEQLRHIWNNTRARIVDVEGDVAVFSAGISDPGLQHSLATLGQSLAETRSVLESNVATRLEPGAGREELVQSSNRAVYDRRPQLLAAIAPVASARR